ncbi:MAG: hypothetical protein JO269_10585 [Burkholderiaceae bacterium]|nr:hypothetical protein [Burkholderiaceae bacterium]
MVKRMFFDLEQQTPQKKVEKLPADVHKEMQRKERVWRAALKEKPCDELVKIIIRQRWEIEALRGGVSPDLGEEIRNTGFSQGRAHQKSSQGRAGALGKLEHDQKQMDKKDVHMHWLEWREGSIEFKSAATFAAKMADDYGLNPKTVEKWCTAWKKDLR